MAENSLQKIVEESAQNRGFHLAGISPVELDEQTLPELSYFSQWVAEGRAGEMTYLKRQDAGGQFLRSSVRVPFPWARSVIVCAVNYNSDEPYSIDPEISESDEKRVWIARYAWSGREKKTEADRDVRDIGGKSSSRELEDQIKTVREATDYHGVIRQRLEQLRIDLQQQLGDFQARCFVDTGPLVERVYAKYAGLGWQAKNTCLINESLGSWFFLGVILTSLELPPEQRIQPMPDRCGSCTRCIDACPTEALQPYRMDASRCISYLTIERRGPIPEEYAAEVGRNVFGCDICQEVCPWNNQKDRGIPVTDWPELQPRSELVNPALNWLESLREDDYCRLFRDSPMERAKFAGFERNIANARRNSQEGL